MFKDIWRNLARRILDEELRKDWIHRYGSVDRHREAMAKKYIKS
jgi:hypothetical protein